MFSRWPSAVLVTVTVLLAGCLPSSCRRIETRTLYPADSLSRQIASGIVPDTLVLKSSYAGTNDEPLEYIRSLLFAADGKVFAADAARGTVTELDRDGQHVRTVESDLFSYPYLAGASGDSVFVFSPGRHRVQLILDGSVKDAGTTPIDIPLKGLLQYAYVVKGTLYAKLLGDEFPGMISQIPADGPAVRVAELPGPTWRHAGFLRSWGDTLVSLNGYRPIIDLLLPDGRRDSLRLTGFDSPMLSRLRLFELGEIDAPPLLTASTAPYRNQLFVLNMRPGWLRIDVYDRNGQLTNVLTGPDPGFNRDYYPTDIAVRSSPEPGKFELGVAILRPEPRIDIYEWSGGR